MIQVKKEKHGDRMDLRKQKEAQDEKKNEMPVRLAKKRFNPAWTEKSVWKKRRLTFWMWSFIEFDVVSASWAASVLSARPSCICRVFFVPGSRLWGARDPILVGHFYLQLVEYTIKQHGLKEKRKSAAKLPAGWPWDPNSRRSSNSCRCRCWC